MLMNLSYAVTFIFSWSTNEHESALAAHKVWLIIGHNGRPNGVPIKENIGDAENNCDWLMKQLW